jgi:hypothetical protein
MASSADRSVTAGRTVRLSVYFAGALVYASIMVGLALAGAVVGLVWDLPRWAVMMLRRDNRRANAAVGGLVIVVVALLLWALVVWIVSS